MTVTRKRRLWTDAEIALLAEVGPSETAAELAVRFGVTAKQVRQVCRYYEIEFVRQVACPTGFPINIPERVFHYWQRTGEDIEAIRRRYWANGGNGE